MNSFIKDWQQAMRVGHRPAVLRYGVAVVTIALAIGGRLQLDPLLGDAFPFALPFFAILLTAWFGGFGPAVAAVVLGGLASSYFLLPPRGSVFQNGTEGWVGIALYAGTGFGIALFGGSLRAAREHGETEVSVLGPGRFATERKIQVGYILALVCLAAVATVALKSEIRSREMADRTRHTEQVIAALHLLFSTATDAETAQRGFSITGVESFLEPYDDARQRLGQEIASLRELTADTPGQQRQLDLLEPILAERMAQAERTIAQRRAGGFAAAQASTATGRGKMLHDQIRAIIAKMVDAERATLDQREKAAQRGAFLVRLLVAGSSTLAFGVVAVALFSIRKDFGRARIAEIALHAANEQLEARVLRRTAALQAANSELEREAAERQAVNERVQWLASFPAKNPNPIVEFDQESGEMRYANAAAAPILLGLGDNGLGHPELAAVREIVRGWDDGQPGLKRCEASIGGASYLLTVTCDLNARRTRIYWTDITERKQAEDARRETQARLNSALAAGSIGTWTWDIINDRLTADDFTARMFSIEEEAAAKGLPAEAYLQAVMEEDQPGVADGLARAIQSCGHYDIEYRVRQKDGEFRWLQAKGRVEGDAAGNAVNFHGAVMDVTARKWAEAQMALEQARFKLIFESIPIGIAFAHHYPDGRITRIVNDAHLQICGLTREQDLIPGIYSKISHPEDSARQSELYRQVEEGRNDEFSMEKRYVRLDGEVVWVVFSYQRKRHADGSFEQMTTVIDITERKRAEDAILQLNARLEQRVAERTSKLETANKELEAFSYSVSHDLRAPLRAVDGFSQAVLEDYATLLPEDGQRYLQTIRQGAQKMGMLIDDLLMFSRLSRMPLNKQVVDADQLARSVFADLVFHESGRQIDLQVNELPACSGDPALLRQVWINLLSNSLKYTRKREVARVEIGCDPTPEGPVFFVRDNGTGFDMRYSDKLFGVFQRLHRAEDYEGTGVGLAIVQRVIHRHGGRVWAEATLDQGATFYFTLEPKIEP